MSESSVYRALVEQLEDQVALARKLGLYRTAKRIHKAVKVARGEIPEAMPRTPEIEFRIGPVREQL